MQKGNRIKRDARASPGGASPGPNEFVYLSVPRPRARGAASGHGFAGRVSSTLCLRSKDLAKSVAGQRRASPSGRVRRHGNDLGTCDFIHSLRSFQDSDFSTGVPFPSSAGIIYICFFRSSSPMLPSEQGGYIQINISSVTDIDRVYSGPFGDTGLECGDAYFLLYFSGLQSVCGDIKLFSWRKSLGLFCFVTYGR